MPVLSSLSGHEVNDIARAAVRPPLPTRAFPSTRAPLSTILKGQAPNDERARSLNPASGRRHLRVDGNASPLCRVRLGRRSLRRLRRVSDDRARHVVKVELSKKGGSSAAKLVCSGVHCGAPQAFLEISAIEEYRLADSLRHQPRRSVGPEIRIRLQSLRRQAQIAGGHVKKRLQPLVQRDVAVFQWRKSTSLSLNSDRTQSPRRGARRRPVDRNDEGSEGPRMHVRRLSRDGAYDLLSALVHDRRRRHRPMLRDPDAERFSPEL